MNHVGMLFDKRFCLGQAQSASSWSYPYIFYLQELLRKRR